jgi:hypothetical protein
MPINKQCSVGVLECEQVPRQVDIRVPSVRKSRRTNSSRMKGSPIKKMTVLFALILLAIWSIPAQAAQVTFNATGQPNVTGFVQFDNSFFLGGTFDQVSNTHITNLSITAFGAVFNLANVDTTANTYINSSGPIPIIVNGGGLLADNNVKAIAFYPDGYSGTPTDGDASLAFGPSGGTLTYYAVRWDVATVPEPATMLLLGLGLMGLAGARRKFKR